MKTFITVAVVAALAIVIVEISQSNAHRHRECEASRRPALNTTAVTCDARSNGTREEQREQLVKRFKCFRTCRKCYRGNKLANPPSCLVGGKCSCLARPQNATTTSDPSQTTVAATSVAPSDAPSSAAPSDEPSSAVPSDEPSSVAPSDEPVTGSE